MKFWFTVLIVIPIIIAGYALIGGMFSDRYTIALVGTLPGSGATEIEMLKDKPEVRFKKWNGEVNMSVSYNQVDAKGEKSVVDNKVTWKGEDNTKEEVHAYPLEAKAGLEDGGFEIEVVLNQKPTTNKFDFTIDGAEDLDFFYQPALTQKEIAKGAQRPENVVGSYAVYHKTKRDHIEGQTNYATGKAYHIYRPKIIDANGVEIWAELRYENGALTVTVPQEFLDTATYPVIVDPTFGYTTIGASSYPYSSTITPTAATSPADSYTASSGDTITSFSIYADDNGSSGTFNMAAYTYSGGFPVTRLSAAVPVTIAVGAPAWYTSATVSQSLSAGTAYVTAFGNTTSNPRVYYDVSGTNPSSSYNSTGPTFPATWTDDGASDTTRHSVYATYSAATAASSHVNLRGGGSATNSNVKIRGGSSGDSFLLSESFDGSSACGDGVGTNCNLTWTLLDTPVLTFNYTTSPAPLEGTNSLLIGTNSAGDEGIDHSFSAQDTVHFFFIVNHKTLVGGNFVFSLDNAPGLPTGDILSISNANPEWRISCGSVFNNTADAIVQGTTYYVWGDYTKGTGSNAVCNLYYSTTSTKPGSPNLTISNGDATAQASSVNLLNSAATAQTIYDKIRINATSIGNNGDVVTSSGSVKFR